ncbi:hypothetical protein VTN49DRAFT_3518 [Thermomyces lanuginosus]|uniref:uncharacterized protein n=1 Tax=Thermomyces lanuginosus TaxID=5541 RepID=UPI003743BF42
MWLPVKTLWAAALSLSLSTVYAAETAQDNPNIRRVPLRTHTLESPYLDSDMHSRWWDFGGDTVIRTDKYIRLTSDQPSQQGWIFSRVPLTASHWEVEVEFKIHGSNHLYGDGMAIWLTKQRGIQGPVFGSTDRFEGLGIFIDTYKNNRPGTSFPYVMAMLGDGQTSYDHAHDGRATELAGCSARGLRGASVPTKARLTYFQDKSLSLDLQWKSEGTWTNCFTLTAPETNFAIPPVSYLGFSAETGEVHDYHDIISVKTHNLYDTGGSNARRPAGAPPTAKGRPMPQKKSGGWGWFFFKIILFVLVIVGGYFGWTVYRMQRRGSRF